MKYRFARLSVFFAFFGFIFSMHASAEDEKQIHISLNDFPLYVRPGFSLNFTNHIPEPDDPLWQLVPENPHGRSFALTDVEYPGKPALKRFDFSAPDYREFTYIIPFELPASSWAAFRRANEKIRNPALFFASLGDNWEIFVNGNRVLKEMHLDEQGKINYHASRKKIIVPLDKDHLKMGSNIVAIRLVGDIKYPTSGMFLNGPYYFGELEDIQRNESELLELVFIALYIFIGIYHLFIFSRRTKDHYNLYWGLFSILLGIYLFSRTASFILTDTNITSRLELAFLYLVIPSLGAFLDHLNLGKVSKLTIAYTTACLVFVLSALAFSMNVAHFTLRIWQATGLFMTVYYWLVRIQFTYFRSVWIQWKTSDKNKRPPLFISLLQKLISSPQGNIALSSSLLFVTAIFDILNSIFWNSSLVLTSYGFLLFTLGTAFILANRFEFLHSRVSELNTSLDDRINELISTSEMLASSERKYKSLFESTLEPVAILDKNLTFIEGNRAAKDFFGLNRANSENLKLTQALYIDEREGQRPIRMLELAASSLTTENPAREDIFRLKTPLGEPKNSLLRLERVKTGDIYELILRVRPDPESLLTKSFIEGRAAWRLASSLSAADEVTRHIGENLRRYAKEEDATFLMICLREIIINAIEHGNLEVGYEDKTKAQMEGRYFEFINERQAIPKYSKRRVTVEYSLTSTKATFRISDEGNGFDHKKFLKAGMEATPELLEHGRGLFMTLNAFDKVIYNDIGNQVSLIKTLA